MYGAGATEVRGWTATPVLRIRRHRRTRTGIAAPRTRTAPGERESHQGRPFLHGPDRLPDAHPGASDRYRVRATSVVPGARVALTAPPAPDTSTAPRTSTRRRSSDCRGRCSACGRAPR